MIKWIPLSWLCIFCIPRAYTQNLIVNGDFNQVNICEANSPCSPSGWYTSYDIDWAYQRIHHYGIENTHCIFLTTGPSTFNYWQSELLVPLSRGNTYKLEYFVRSTEEITDPDAVQISFTASRTFLMGKNRLDTVAIINFQKKRIKRGKYNWVKVSMRFRAEGFEKWVLIGRTAKQETRQQLYAFDNIKLIPSDKVSLSKDFIAGRTKELTSNRSRHELPRKEHIAPDIIIDTLRIYDLLFEVDSFKLKGHNNLSILDSLSKKIFERGFSKIIVNGHTDNSGADTHNMNLSTLRAKAVRDYLIKTGIPPAKIDATGYGSSQPLNDNSSEQQKRQNRRVEVLILREQ